MIVSATDLSSYLFCPRRLYASKVLGIRDPANKAMVMGTVRHDTHDFIAKNQEVLVRQIAPDATQEQVLTVFKKDYLQALKKVIVRHQHALQGVDIVPGDLFVDVWPHILEEATVDAQRIYKFARKKNLAGPDLWEQLTPKLMSEYHVQSEQLALKGIIDRIEVHESKYVPVELKTGRPPREGVWPGHKVQVGVYELLLSEAFSSVVNEGYVRYLDQRSSRPVMMNPFLREEILQLVSKVQALLESDALPEPCGKRVCSCPQIQIAR